MENMDLGVSDSANGAKFDQLQISGSRENPVKSDAQVIVVSAPSTNSTFDIPFTQLRTMDGQAIDIGQLGMLNTQSLQLSSVMGGSGLGEITIMGTLMASQAGDGNQINLVPSVSLNSNDTDETQGMSTEQNYAFTPIQNVFNVIGIPQGGDQTEMYPTNINCDQTLPSQSSLETTLSEEVKVTNAETTGVSEESGNVVQNVQLSWQEASSMRSSNIQLVIPEEIVALDQASSSETGTPKFHQNVEINRLPNLKYVSLLSSKSTADKGKAEKLPSGTPSYNEISGDRQRAGAVKTQEEEDHWPTDTEDLEKKSKNQIYSMVLDQLLNQHSALVEMIDICQTVNSSDESVQFEKAVRIFTEKLSSLLEFLGIVKTVIDNCLGRELKVDQSTQTEEGDELSNHDVKPPVYSSVSGRKIRQTERFQGFLEQENGSTISGCSQFENKPQIRKRKKKGSHQNCDSIQENVGKVEEIMLTTESRTPPPASVSTSISDQAETLDVVIPNGTEQLDFVAPEEKEKIYLNGCSTNRLDDASNWVKHPSNLDVGTVRSDVGLKRKTFKTKKQYEAEAQFKFFCPQCSFKSKRSSHFSRHLELHEKFTELYTCKLCNFKTIRQSTLRKHEINHSSSQVRCKECPYVTDSDILLKRHVNIKHGSRKRRHRKEKTLTYIYNCPHCGETVPNLAKYRLHLKMHNVDTDVEELTYQCDQCPYKTKRKEHMKRHRMNHSADRPHLCDTCGMTFKRSDTLNQHKQVHLEKVQRKLNFPCQICKKAFRSKCHLAEHMAMHSNSRQFLCDICGASFKTKSCQLKHVKNIHQNPRSFPCQVCEKRFNTNYALKRHERTHENDLKMMTASTNVLVAQNFLTDVSAQGINQAELVQATDIIIAPSMDETYEQSNDVKLQQVLSENNSAIMFLSSSLPTSWS